MYYKLRHRLATEARMKDEEVMLLEEQLATAQADIERLEAALADAAALAATHESAARGAKRELATLRADLDRREEKDRDCGVEVESLRAAVTAAEERARLAAARYRETALALDPEVPADLVGGDSIEAIDESLVRARQTVAQVRAQIEQSAAAQRVPAGA